jgi:DNA repair protein SbcC/Rad50
VRILELSLRNYRVFEQVDLELPARVIGIFGANGSGKSTLMEAVGFACYGGTRTSKDQIRTQGVLTDCSVRLVFEHGGQQYEARRTIKGRNHQVEAELLVGGAALAVGVREVEQEIRRLLRMDQQIFRSSVFAEQKQLDAFSDLTRSKRKEMVLRLLGVRPVDDARTAARKAARETKVDAERLAGALPDLSEREAAVDAAEEALAKAVERSREARAGLERAGEAFEGAEAALVTVGRSWTSPCIVPHSRCQAPE